MSDNGELEDKPPAPPVRMSSTIFSTGGKDPLSANHSLKPLPSVPEEKKPRHKIISIFSGTEKAETQPSHWAQLFGIRNEGEPCVCLHIRAFVNIEITCSAALTGLSRSSP
ncbi:hypothetical protein H8959_009129 [Pygathrix nigripes]